jgi:hypothetical protein
MTRYCLVTGTEVPANLTVHRLDCPGYDLATVLSEGRIVNLGKFDSSLMALFAIKSVQPTAAPCPDCCDQESKPTPGLLRWAAPAHLLLPGSA